MAKPDDISERELNLRKELADRTIDMHSTARNERVAAERSPEILEIGREISCLINDEKLEQARDRLTTELAKHPDELMFLNFKMILDGLDKPLGDYSQAKTAGLELIEKAVDQENIYYMMAAINNFGLIAHNEGHDEFSLAMYLIAYHFDNKALSVLCNLAGWYSRRNKMDQAMNWIVRIIDNNPNWKTDKEIVTFFSKNESLNNLRQYDRFKQEILSEIKK
jgi:tetratricopeptide (TPR) repeat protein